MIAAPPIRLPETLSITCLADETVWADALILVTLKMLYKNDFHLVVGPSDANGLIEVTKAEMEAQAQTDTSLFVMDYTPLLAFSGEIVIHPMDISHLDAAIEAFNLYHSFFPYPSEYPNSLQSAIKKLKQLAPTRLLVHAKAHGAGADAVKVNAESIAL